MPLQRAQSCLVVIVFYISSCCFHGEKVAYSGLKLLYLLCLAIVNSKTPIPSVIYHNFVVTLLLAVNDSDYTVTVEFVQSLIWSLCLDGDRWNRFFLCTLCAVIFYHLLWCTVCLFLLLLLRSFVAMLLYLTSFSYFTFCFL